MTSKSMASHKICRSVLVVEDEPSIRENLHTLLALEGFSVYSASNGEEGLRVLRSMPQSCLVLLDLLMPIMNGEEFIDAKNQDERLAAIPVCIVSGVADNPNLPNVSEFLMKPIDFDRLLKVVKHYCERGK